MDKRIIRKGTGFFSFLKAVNRISNDLLISGKEYAIKFKAGEITAQEYESDLVGEIYALTNKYSNNNIELEKDIKNKFSDLCAKYLKEGINLYVESLQLTDKNKEDEDEDEKKPPLDTVKMEKEEKAIPDNKNGEINSSTKVIASSKEINSLLNSLCSMVKD